MDIPETVSHSGSQTGTPLRQKAEEQFIKKDTAKEFPKTEGDILKLIHELEVHQIELEMQNEELRKAKEIAEGITVKYTTLYDFAPAGYFTINYDGTIFEMNHTGAAMLGKERSVMVGISFSQFVSSDTIALFNDFLLQIFQTNEKQKCIVKLINNNKPSSYILLEGIVSENKNKCLLSGIDITEQQLTKQMLQSSEARYRRLFESAKDGILILDAESGKIIDANPYLINKIGYSYEELLGKELWEVGTLSNIAASKEAFIELQNNEYIRFEDMPLKTKNGNQINVEFVSNVYLVDHKKVIQCNIRDITDRKLVERNLIKSETALRELNANKDKFFSIISHDLRSPFNSIIGYSNILLEQVRAKDYEAIEEYAETIQKSSLLILDLLVNLLEWSRSQSGKMNFNPEYLEFFALINNALELSKHPAQQKSITIINELPHNITVYADKAMVNAIVRNLISNAIKYTNTGGKIVVSAIKNKDELEVAINDNGIGMQKETIDKLFHIEEVNSTMGTQNEEGSGLGLVLCKEFVLKHGGKIWVKSEPGKGSTFYFTLPLMSVKYDKGIKDENIELQEDTTVQLKTEGSKLKTII